MVALLEATGSLHAIDDEPMRARFRCPDLSGPPENLPHAGASAVARERLELLLLGVEPHHRIGAPVAHPDLVAGIDVDGVRARVFSGKPPGLPRCRGRVEAADVTAVPLADPDPAPGVGPHAARALPLRRGLD